MSEAKFGQKTDVCAIASIGRGEPNLRGWLRCSRVAKQGHETEVHVLLDMAVKQRQARLVGDQIHCGASKCGNDHRVFLDAGSLLTVEFNELEHVPMEVQRVRVVAAIVKHQPVAASLSEHKFPFMRILFTV